MPKINFEFNAKKELFYIKFFEKKFGKVNISDELRTILNDDKKAINFLNKKYSLENKQNYERNWRKIEKDYFSNIEKLTNKKWSYKKYNVILTKYMPGFCNPYNLDTKEVTVRQDYPIKISNYIIAHELFHSHYHKIASIKKNKKLLKTELNENCAILSLLFSDLKKIFIKKKDEHIIKMFINSNHKSKKYFYKLLKIWNSKKDFNDYLKRSLNII